MNYFYGSATGLNADIERHRKKIKELQKKLDEAIANNDEFRVIVYRHYIQLAEASKAEVVSKLGI